jgi:hypothetical protein
MIGCFFVILQAKSEILRYNLVWCCGYVKLSLNVSGGIVNNNPFSVVHRLPQSYRWLSGYAGVKVEAILLPAEEEESNLIGLKLLSPEGDSARSILQGLNLSLREIEVESNIVECDGELCLFVKRDDESAAMCRLKNIGTAIAESVSVSALYPF